MSPYGRRYWFDGRIPRFTYWVCSIGLNLAGLVVFAVLGAGFGALLVGETTAFGAAIFIFFLGFAAIFYFNLVVLIKRWHDRDKQAWYVLILFIPLIGPIWTFVELGFLAGTDGENRYGDDPRRQDWSMPHHRNSQPDERC